MSAANRRRMGFLGLLLATAAGVGACSPPPPFVLRPGEFDRTADDFNKPFTGQDEVTVCYNSSSATPAQVRSLAQEVCANDKKQAVFKGAAYLECPVFVPAGAMFSCLGPEDRVRRTSSGRPYPLSHGKGPYAWSYTAEPSPLESRLPPRPESR